MTWIKKNSKTTYVDFIQSIDGTIVTDPYHPNLPDKAVYIRHDIDDDINGAAKFAIMEAENNIQSTYFFLHTTEYFYSDYFKTRVESIMDNNHKTGLHHDVLSIWWKNRSLNVLELFKKPMLYLQDFATISGVSCHGAREHYDREYINYQLWTQYNDRENEGFEIKWPQISLNFVGIDYEAYFLPYTHYFSDSGNNWIGYKVAGQKPFERTALYSDNNIGTDIIRKWNDAEKGLFQVLVHPQHWEEV